MITVPLKNMSDHIICIHTRIDSVDAYTRFTYYDSKRNRYGRRYKFQKNIRWYNLDQIDLTRHSINLKHIADHKKLISKLKTI